MTDDVRDLLRDLWRHGVRVRLEPDRLRLDPPGVTPEPLRAALLQRRDDVKDVLAGLPAPNHCQACGDPTRGPSGNAGHIHCTVCALALADRRGWRVLPELEVAA